MRRSRSVKAQRAEHFGVTALQDVDDRGRLVVPDFGTAEVMPAAQGQPTQQDCGHSPGLLAPCLCLHERPRSTTRIREAMRGKAYTEADPTKQEELERVHTPRPGPFVCGRESR